MRRERYGRISPVAHAIAWKGLCMTRSRRFVYGLAVLLSCGAYATAGKPQERSSNEVISIDLNGPSHPFPHFWEEMFGSGRAILSLRESYRDDLRQVKKITDFRYVRFHGILDDEVGVYNEDASGSPVYNFSYVDQIYDGLLANGVRPFVELSFMPQKLASANIFQGFWYKPNVSPPKTYDRWGSLVQQFAQHLVNRYGIDEVSKWYFEVWNEPNLDFWGGEPKEQTYFQLYGTAAKAIKRVNPRLRVGGPATAQAAWVDSFIQYAVRNNVPLDFVSSHVYGNDKSEDVFGTHEIIPRTQMVCRAIAKVHRQILSSERPKIPLVWSEFNASYMNEPDVTDTDFMGPWLADTIRQCDGLVQMMSYWTFSDVFEEQGVVKKPFYGGFGLMAEDAIPKPSFNAFRLLHELGDTRITVDSSDALVTRRKDGRFAIAVWNLSLPKEEGEAKSVEMDLKGLSGSHTATIQVVDADYGSPLKAYAAMGSPTDPTRAQIETLRRAALLPPPALLPIRDGRIKCRLAPKALALIEIR